MVNPNIRGHTGDGLSMRLFFPIVSSTKQNLNTKSSTETEIVEVDDYMPDVLCTRYCLYAQGYIICENIVYQDNKCAIILENNDKVSISKCTKHINIRYYFVTYCIEKDELSIE